MAKEDAYDPVERRSLEAGKWMNLVMGMCGVAAAYASHSDALLVDGLYSGVNFISAIIAGRISLAIQKPADRRYPFGYVAYEALYVKYRSLVLLGILTFAILGAVSKMISYAMGQHVPELVFGPILAYMILMVAMCFGLALWHRYNWQRSGRRSELLSMEVKAAVVDGIISAGAGGGLLAMTLLRGTTLEFIVPISDSIVVLIMSLCIINQPARSFQRSLLEVAGRAASAALVQQVLHGTRQRLQDRPIAVLEVAVTKMGRSHFVVPYLQPESPLTARDVDALRHELDDVYADLLGDATTEIILTAEHPFRPKPSPGA